MRSYTCFQDSLFFQIETSLSIFGALIDLFIFHVNVWQGCGNNASDGQTTRNDGGFIRIIKTLRIFKVYAKKIRK